MSIDPAKRVALNTSFLYLRMGLTVIITLYATRLVLNALGTDDFGIFNIVGGTIAMLTFLNNAMAGATQRFMSFAEGEGNIEKQKNIFNVSITLHFIISLFVVVLLEIGSLFLFDGILNMPENRIHAAKIIYQFLIVNIFFTIISVPYDAVLNAHENMFFVAVLGILEAVLKLVIAIYITNINSDRLIQYGLLMSILSILLLFIRQIYCSRKYIEVQIKIRKYYDKILMIEMTKFASWNLLSSTISIVSNSGQAIVSNIFFGTKINAAQGIANQVNGQVSVFSSTMLKALSPAITKSGGAGNLNGMIRMSVLGSKLSFYLLAIFAIPIYIELPFIMKAWLINVPDFAIIFCRLLIIRTLIEMIVSSLPVIINTMGDIKYYQIYMSIIAIFPLPIAYLLFNYGYPPTTIYILFIIQAVICSFIIIPFFVKRNTDISIIEIFKKVFLPSILVFTISFSLSGLSSYLLNFYIESNIIKLLIVSVFSLIVTLFSIRFWGLTKNELEILSNLTNSFYAKFISTFKNLHIKIVGMFSH